MNLVYMVPCFMLSFIYSEISWILVIPASARSRYGYSVGFTKIWWEGLFQQIRIRSMQIEEPLSYWRVGMPLNEYYHASLWVLQIVCRQTRWQLSRNSLKIFRSYSFFILLFSLNFSCCSKNVFTSSLLTKKNLAMAITPNNKQTKFI